MKKLNRKIIGRVCVGIVLLALVLWLMPLPLPFHISLSGVRVEDSTAAEPAAPAPTMTICISILPLSVFLSFVPYKYSLSRCKTLLGSRFFGGKLPVPAFIVNLYSIFG